jgi:hypothetical protein
MDLEKVKAFVESEVGRAVEMPASEPVIHAQISLAGFGTACWAVVYADAPDAALKVALVPWSSGALDPAKAA